MSKKVILTLDNYLVLVSVYLKVLIGTYLLTDWAGVSCLVCLNSLIWMHNVCIICKVICFMSYRFIWLLMYHFQLLKIVFFTPGNIMSLSIAAPLTPLWSSFSMSISWSIVSKVHFKSSKTPATHLLSSEFEYLLWLTWVHCLWNYLHGI